MPRYIPALDGIRAVAIGAVLCNHANSGYSLALTPPLRAAFARGWYGADAFFVLSGFLITSIILAEVDATGTLNLRRFYVRRTLRLIPAYLVACLVTLASVWLTHSDRVSTYAFSLLFLLTYTFNVAFAFGYPARDFVHAWTLSLEEQFYAAWPLVMLRLRRKCAFRLAVTGIVAAAIWRVILFAILSARGTDIVHIWRREYFASDTHFDVVLVGCVAALLLDAHAGSSLIARMRRGRWFAGTAVLLACAAVTWGAATRERVLLVGQPVMAAAVALAIVAVAIQPSSLSARVLGSPLMARFGRLSYAAYLYHMLVLAALARALGFQAGVPPTGGRTFVLIVSSYAMVMAIADLHFRFLELPILEYRSRRFSGGAESALDDRWRR